MTLAPEVTQAAVHILNGDDSGVAAATLERAIHSYHPFDDRLEDLLEALALYAPFLGAPYTDYPQLCEAIRQSPIFERDEGGTP